MKYQLNYYSPSAKRVVELNEWDMDSAYFQSFIRSLISDHPELIFFFTIVVEPSTDIWSEGPLIYHKYHKRHNLKGRPVCGGDDSRDVTGIMVADIDRVDCVECLRALAKDAVLYGRDRRPKRGW